MPMRKLLATGLGTGLLPVAPGTWGSAAVIGIYLALCLTGPIALNLALAGLVVAGSVACVWTGPYAERHFGRKDPGQVTIDEWAGQALALLLLPLAPDWTGRLIVAGVAFGLFRVLDIVKPFPARGIQVLPAGWGILLDDLVTGLYANILAQILFRVIWPGVA